MTKPYIIRLLFEIIATCHWIVIICFALGYISIYLKLRKCCNFWGKYSGRVWHVIPAQEVMGVTAALPKKKNQRRFSFSLVPLLGYIYMCVCMCVCMHFAFVSTHCVALDVSAMFMRFTDAKVVERSKGEIRETGGPRWQGNEGGRIVSLLK